MQTSQHSSLQVMSMGIVITGQAATTHPNFKTKQTARKSTELIAGKNIAFWCFSGAVIFQTASIVALFA